MHQKWWGQGDILYTTFMNSRQLTWAQIIGWGKWDVAFSGGSPSWTHGIVSCFSGNIEVLLPTYVWSNTSASGGVGHRRTISGSSSNGQNPLSKRAITQKELIPIVIAGLVWRKHWAGKVVQFNSDNQAVVTAMTKLYCRDTCLMGYLRCLVFCAARYCFWFTAKHIPGSPNILEQIPSHVIQWLSQAPPTMERSLERLPKRSHICSAFRNRTGSPQHGGGCSTLLLRDSSPLH